MHSAFYLRARVGEASHVNMLTKQLESLQTYISTAVKTEEQQPTQKFQAPPPQFSQPPPMYSAQIPQPMMGVTSLGGFQPQTIQGQQAMQTQQFMGQQFGHQ